MFKQIETSGEEFKLILSTKTLKQTKMAVINASEEKMYRKEKVLIAYYVAQLSMDTLQPKFSGTVWVGCED